MVYFYFSYVDPWGVQPRPLQDLVVFVVVTGTIVVATFLSSLRLFRPLQEWRERLHRGADPGEVPAHLRRRALNRPLIAAAFSMTGWTLAGIFYLPYQLWVVGFDLEQAWRVFVAIVFVGGPVASTLAFLVAEYYSRRDVPLFFPEGRLERSGVLRVPILVRLGATFFVTSVLPPLLMLMVSVSLVRRFGGELPEEMRPLWVQLLRTQAYIVVATGGASFVMALLVARFINRPVQALRSAMAQVAAGDLDVRVPVRSTDELGELNERFNAMVEELRRAARMRELFGRYVSRAVAEQALERGIALGGELAQATAMFVDLRGFTALTQRVSPARVVELLNEYYAIVARVIEREGGLITQFVGDAVNQAARLQVKTRDLGAPILLTESTRAALGETNGLVLRPCGAVPLKGVAAPVEVYAVEA